MTQNDAFTIEILTSFVYLQSNLNQIITEIIHASVTLRKVMYLLVVIKFHLRSAMDHLSAFEEGSTVDLFFLSCQRTFHEGPVIATYLTMEGIPVPHISGNSAGASMSWTRSSASRAMGSPRYPGGTHR
jgi:hypothetical protein